MHDHDVLQPIPDIFLPLVADTDAQIFLKIKAVIHCYEKNTFRIYFPKI